MVWKTPSFSDIKGVVTRTREPSRVGDHERVERDSSARPPLHRLSKPAEELGADVSELAERVQAVGHLLRFHHVHGLMAARWRPLRRRRPSAIAASLSRALACRGTSSSSVLAIFMCQRAQAENAPAPAPRCTRARLSADAPTRSRPLSRRRPSGIGRTDSTPCSAYYPQI